MFIESTFEITRQSYVILLLTSSVRHSGLVNYPGLVAFSRYWAVLLVSTVAGWCWSLCFFTIFQNFCIISCDFSFNIWKGPVTNFYNIEAKRWVKPVRYCPIQSLMVPYCPLWSHTVPYCPIQFLTVPDSP